MIDYHTAKATAGVPLGFGEFFGTRTLRVRSLSGKWATLLETNSEVLATEAYNQISNDIRRGND